MRLCIVALAAFQLSTSTVSATPVPVAEQAMRPSDIEEVVGALRKTLVANYVLPERRTELDSILKSGLAEHRYDRASPSVLVKLVNADLQSIVRDKHLAFRFNPEQQRKLLAASQQGTKGADGPTDEEIRDSIRDNHGIRKIELLPGNVRYVGLTAFGWVGAASEKAYDQLIDFLEGGDAIIIDLRQNGGGNPAAVQYLASAFLNPGRRLTTFYMGREAVATNDALPNGPSGRLKGKPLYVLTSSETASAAEGFTGTIGGYHLGEIIGETTAGAGYRNDLFPLPHGFFASVSIGRAVLASTGKDWEGIGIVPTTKVPQEKALEVAQAHALRSTASAAGAAGDP